LKHNGSKISKFSLIMILGLFLKRAKYLEFWL
jgi:hypothetical protein